MKNFKKLLNTLFFLVIAYVVYDEFILSSSDKENNAIKIEQIRNICLIGEVHIYTDQEMKYIQPYLDQADIIMHEAFAYGEKDSSWITTLNDWYISLMYTAIEPFASLDDRHQYGAYSFAIEGNKKQKKFIGLEKDGKNIIFLPFVGLFFVAVFILHISFLIRNILFSKKKVPNTMWILFKVSVILFIATMEIEVTLMRDIHMANRITHIENKYPNDCIVVGLGKAHLDGVYKRIQ